MQETVINKKRKVQDNLRNLSTILATAIGIIVLLSIILYVFINGFKTLSWNMLVSDYKSELVTVKLESFEYNYENPKLEDTYFSYNYGIALKDSKDNGGNDVVIISYIDEKSPFLKAICIDKTENNNLEIPLEKGTNLDLMMGIGLNEEFVMASASDGAEEYAKILDMTKKVNSLHCTTSGGGIRGSLLTTLLLIIVTLIISIPLGVGAAIYLVEYAKEGKLKRIITTMIDMTSGIPSIIFGFCGALIFIPFASAFGGNGGYSILAGAFTMTIVLLPTIIKTTSEALLVIPNHFTMASLALGASKTQTVFKVILPNAIPGILTAVLLSIGRIIGESAALMFVMGTNISDSVSLLGQSTSLSLHIWSITAGENPNYEAACSISIIILLVVFLLSISVKLISKKINKMAV